MIKVKWIQAKKDDPIFTGGFILSSEPRLFPSNCASSFFSLCTFEASFTIFWAVACPFLSSTTSVCFGRSGVFEMFPGGACI